MKPVRAQPLGECVRQSLAVYFADLEGTEAQNLYPLVIGEIEKPLLQAVMHQAGGNQSRAARMLGINRNTLRKKLTQYGLS
ncbi:MAG: DNA-binding transcriptional regulator Fis [Acidiferrobacteraceae bacterium]|jgi:Fis family transcriptional regulator|nr:DNA-binding transcriptional regulator Fis [Acidiferrobacteraceae bacterium]MBT3639450.1 DNA-binding transcriptional regulator Fis [Acidiferrobacteraceae bacterium]MBT3771078.1 DNA-binding transcriptional regulator Fis [Acidiferrobacteraceae bacterium]MBT3973633.1 DNA-binding transcriptional regulator Fis [Acidiferrobacteraceae bacterium]MBT4396316.1 DNA-binding transcriptional regulator Fis [Acidiferrobacteraceae bacterium]